jgi:hypothetical protein
LNYIIYVYDLYNKEKKISFSERPEKKLTFAPDSLPEGIKLPNDTAPFNDINNIEVKYIYSLEINSSGIIKNQKEPKVIIKKLLEKIKESFTVIVGFLNNIYSYNQLITNHELLKKTELYFNSAIDLFQVIMDTFYLPKCEFNKSNKYYTIIAGRKKKPILICRESLILDIDNDFLEKLNLVYDNLKIIIDGFKEAEKEAGFSKLNSQQFINPESPQNTGGFNVDKIIQEIKQVLQGEDFTKKAGNEDSEDKTNSQQFNNPEFLQNTGNFDLDKILQKIRQLLQVKDLANKAGNEAGGDILNSQQFSNPESSQNTEGAGVGKIIQEIRQPLQGEDIAEKAGNEAGGDIPNSQQFSNPEFLKNTGSFDVIKEIIKGFGSPFHKTEYSYLLDEVENTVFRYEIEANSKKLNSQQFNKPEYISSQSNDLPDDFQDIYQPFQRKENSISNRENEAGFNKPNSQQCENPEYPQNIGSFGNDKIVEKVGNEAGFSKLNSQQFNNPESPQNTEGAGI